MSLFSQPRRDRALWGLLLAVLAWPAAGGALDSASEQALLKAADAFRLSAQIVRPGLLRLHWSIAPHYYLYRDRIHVDFSDAGIRAEPIRLPAGQELHDPYLGHVEIYRDALDASIMYAVAGAHPSNLRVSVTSQGCHEIDPKICYPPSTQILELPLGTVSGADAAIVLPTTRESGATNPLAALQRMRAIPRPPAFQPVGSIEQVQRAVAEAAAADRPVLLDFDAEKCGGCESLETQTFAEPAVRDALEGFVLLRADVTADDTAGRALLRRYGLARPPAVLLFGSNGKERRDLRLLGFEAPADFLHRLRKASP
ncbi:MAG: thioredoxin family protein [Proteobacteria bacterium]|nr:thioredoxin family protein [Pseudomonadota bacterium]